MLKKREKGVFLRGKDELVCESSNIIPMTPQQVKEAMMKSIGAEIDTWLEESVKIKSGYDYEDRFLFYMRRVGKIMMEKSIGEAGNNRNKKNFIPA